MKHAAQMTLAEFEDSLNLSEPERLAMRSLSVSMTNSCKAACPIFLLGFGIDPSQGMKIFSAGLAYTLKAVVDHEAKTPAKVGVE